MLNEYMANITPVMLAPKMPLIYTCAHTHTHNPNITKIHITKILSVENTNHMICTKC